VNLTGEYLAAILTNKNWLKPLQKPVKTNTKTIKQTKCLNKHSQTGNLLGAPTEVIRQGCFLLLGHCEV
jgi:hypothetical protein